jgi:hypothetical protein
MTNSENLWPTFEPSEIVSPKTLMVEQANFLSESTKNVILGQVSSKDSQSTNNQIIHSFVIIAPALNNYRFILFEVSYGIYLYPLVLYYQQASIQIENEEQFKDKMKEIFNSDITRRIVTSLYSQSV